MGGSPRATKPDISFEKEKKKESETAGPVAPEVRVHTGEFMGSEIFTGYQCRN